MSFVEIDAELNILGDHFGWIGFNLFENPGGPHGVEVTRWGYETLIDTPITIPSPGAAPLLLTAAALITHRRRRPAASHRRRTFHSTPTPRSFLIGESRLPETHGLESVGFWKTAQCVPYGDYDRPTQTCR